MQSHMQRLSRFPRKSSLPASKYRNRHPRHAVQHPAGKNTRTQIALLTPSQTPPELTEAAGEDTSDSGYGGLSPARAAGAAPSRALGVSDSSEAAAPGISLPVKSRLEGAKHPPATAAEQALQPLPLRFSLSRSRRRIARQRSRLPAPPRLPGCACNIALISITLQNNGRGKQSLGLQLLTALREIGIVHSRH